MFSCRIWTISRRWTKFMQNVRTSLVFHWFERDRIRWNLMKFSFSWTSACAINSSSCCFAESKTTLCQWDKNVAKNFFDLESKSWDWRRRFSRRNSRRINSKHSLSFDEENEKDNRILLKHRSICLKRFSFPFRITKKNKRKLFVLVLRLRWSFV